jgi:hypothetical protein
MWMRSFLSEHRHGGRGSQVLTGMVDYERYSLPDFGVYISRFEGLHIWSGRRVIEDPFVGYKVA